MGRTSRIRRKRRRTWRVVPCMEYLELYRMLHRAGWRNELELQVAGFPETGNGLFSRRSVKAGDCLIRLPLEILISWKTIEENDDFLSRFEDKILDELKSELQFQSLLAFYLSFLISVQDSASEAYIKSLPESFTVPYFCSKLEMRFLPEIILRMMVIQNGTIKNNFNLIQSLLKAGHQNIVTLEQFKWAYFVVNTRSVYLDPKVIKLCPKKKLSFEGKLSDEANMALAPFLDFFNHDSNAKTISRISIPYENLSEPYNFSTDGLFYELVTETKFEAFSQLFISYGCHNNTKLLIEYGFCLENNVQDYYEVSLEDINAFVKYDPQLRPLKIHREKYRFLADHHLTEQMFFIQEDLLSNNLAVTLTILFVEQNIYQLRQIAFGEILDIEPIRGIALRFIDFKLLELKNYTVGLSKHHDPLTPSAKSVLAYFQECTKLLNKIRLNL